LQQFVIPVQKQLGSFSVLRVWCCRLSERKKERIEFQSQIKIVFDLSEQLKNPRVSLIFHSLNNLGQTKKKKGESFVNKKIVGSLLCIFGFGSLSALKEAMV